MPHIDTVRKNNEIKRKRVMKTVLVVTSFSSNEEMPNESSAVLSELDKIENFHIDRCIRKLP